jgi:hypothetical protein
MFAIKSARLKNPKPKNVNKTVKTTAPKNESVSARSRNISQDTKQRTLEQKLG